MAEILDYQAPTAKPVKDRPFFRDFVIAGIINLVIGCILGVDYGTCDVTLKSVMGGFWAGVIIVGIRRRTKMTKTDHFYMWFACLIFTIVCYPIVAMLRAHYGYY